MAINKVKNPDNDIVADIVVSIAKATYNPNKFVNNDNIIDKEIILLGVLLNIFEVAAGVINRAVVINAPDILRDNVIPTDKNIIIATSIILGLIPIAAAIPSLKQCNTNFL